MTGGRVKRSFLWTLTHTLNRATKRFARSGYGPFSLVRHVGRTSGTVYETPLILARVDDGFVAELTYGPGVQWFRNIVAAGNCVVTFKGVEHEIAGIEPFTPEAGRRAFGYPAAFILKLLRRRDFRFLRDAGAGQAHARQGKADGRMTVKAGVPRWVPYFNILARRMLALGLPIGPDVLLTVRGRKSGMPRSTPITLCENAGRRGLISPFGDTDWVRNLRAAGTATLTLGRRTEAVSAVELNPTEAGAFIRDVLAPHARRTRLGSWFVRHIDKIDVDSPMEAARDRPIFELQVMDATVQGDAP